MWRGESGSGWLRELRFRTLLSGGLDVAYDAPGRSGPPQWPSHGFAGGVAAIAMASDFLLDAQPGETWTDAGSLRTMTL